MKNFRTPMLFMIMGLLMVMISCTTGSNIVAPETTSSENVIIVSRYASEYDIYIKFPESKIPEWAEPNPEMLTSAECKLASKKVTDDNRRAVDPATGQILGAISSVGQSDTSTDWFCTREEYGPCGQIRQYLDSDNDYREDFVIVWVPIMVDVITEDILYAGYRYEEL